MALKDLAMKFNNDGGIPFMEDREKMDLPTGSTVTINDFGFIKGDDGDFVVLSLVEFPQNFFFGGRVITEKMKELKAELSPFEMKELQRDGLPVLFTKKANKKGNRSYMACEFYPVDELGGDVENAEELPY